VVTAAQVKELREKTGAGMMDCKKALVETGGDMEKAVEYLQKKGLAAAAKKAGRTAAEGVVEAYIHAGGRIGVLVEVNCETDFVARNDSFREFVHNIALQVAAADPKYVRREEVPEAEIEKQKEILRAQAESQGKPPQIIEKIVSGRLEKYYHEVCLLEQPYIKDPDLKIEDLVKQMIASIGENIVIRRFARFAVGEGMTRENKDFAQEVQEQVTGG